MNNILLSLAYDGSEFFGWQKTSMGPSIESCLETALCSLLGTKPYLQAASRTDRGVHAKDQKVNFLFSKAFSVDDLPKQLQPYLPPSIALVSATSVPLSFHPSLSAKKKEYRYYLSLGTYQRAFERSFSWHYPYLLNIEEMKKAIPILLGLHDFSGFTSEPANNPLCHLYHLEVIPKNERELVVVMEADRFLYHMARTIVGTLLYVGRGKIRLHALCDVFTSKDRKKAGLTAPPHGLFLEKITYQ